MYWPVSKKATSMASPKMRWNRFMRAECKAIVTAGPKKALRRVRDGSGHSDRRRAASLPADEPVGDRARAQQRRRRATERVRDEPRELLETRLQIRARQMAGR